MSPEAREKLSRPGKHSDAMADAIEKLKTGAIVADLSSEERDAYRAYRRRLDAARRDEINANARERYQRKQETVSDGRTGSAAGAVAVGSKEVPIAIQQLHSHGGRATGLFLAYQSLHNLSNEELGVEYELN